MATYLQGVTDYIPDYQPFQPDYNFYANVLQLKQNQYDTNYGAVNNLYADLYNAPLTHELNKEKKDILLKQIDNNLKKVSGLDLSLEQNVTQATQVFKPFYEDKYLMKDMAFTKNAYNVLGRAQALQNSLDDKQAAKYWPTGIKAINYRIQDFADATLDQTLNMANVKYTPYSNAIQGYLDMAKKLNISAETKMNIGADGKPDPYGSITVRQKNGNLIIPSLQELFTAEYSKNPQLQAVYAEEAYVKRKDWVAQHSQEYGDDNLATEKAYLQKKYDYVSSLINKRTKGASQALEVTKNKSASVDKDVKDGNVNPKQKAYQEALASGATVQEAILASYRAINADLNDGNRTVVTEGNSGGLNLENLELARLKVDSGMASVLATLDINAAAKAYSTTDYVYEQDISKMGLERIRHANRKGEIALNAQLKDQVKRRQDYEKWGLANDVFIYDERGNIVKNERYDQTMKEVTSDAGQTSEIDIDLRKENERIFNKTTRENLDPWIDNWFINIKNLIEAEDISLTDRELAKLMKTENRTTILNAKIQEMFGDQSGGPDKMLVDAAKNVLEMEGVTDFDEIVIVPFSKEEVADARKKFDKLYNIWSKNKARGRKEVSPVDGGGDFEMYFENWNKWAIQNDGHKVSTDYFNEANMPSIANAQTQILNAYANEKIFDKNYETINDKLIESVATLPYFNESEKEEIAQIFNDQVHYITDPSNQLEMPSVVLREFALQMDRMYDKLRQKTSPLIDKKTSYGREYTVDPDEPNIQFGKEGPKYTKQYRGNIRKLSDEQMGKITGMYYDHLNRAYQNVVYNPDTEDSGLLTYIHSSGSRGGRATLAADNEVEYVNLANPGSQGFKDLRGMLKDIQGMNFNQKGNYRISNQGNIKITDEDVDEGALKHDIDPNLAQRLLETAFLEARQGTKLPPIKLTNSQIAMEDETVGSMTVFFPREFLEKHIKSVPFHKQTKLFGMVIDERAGDTDEKGLVTASIDRLVNKGLTFIAPKSMWTNDFFTGNQPDQTESIINALGSIKYTDPNGAGTFELRKVTDVPGVTHAGFMKGNYIQPDGTVKEVTKTIYNSINRGGETIGNIQAQMFQTLNMMAKINLQLYRDFHKDGNQQVIDTMNEKFGYTPADLGYSTYESKY